MRNRIGQEDKERLVRAYQSPEQDFLAVADSAVQTPGFSPPAPAKKTPAPAETC